MSWSTWLGWASFPLVSLPFPLTSTQKALPPAEKKSTEAAFQKAKQRCQATAPKAATYFHCLEDAKRRLRNPAPPPKPVSALDRELAACQSLGKGPAIAQCRREARKRVEALRASPKRSSQTPLQRQLQGCQSLGKPVAVDRCRSQALKASKRP
ncbi:MAG TPA: hypothetical protein VJR29_08125 [bacterium]|nr:hypothetical protein [bacterium]